MRSQRKHPGIEERRAKSGEVSYLATVFDARTGKRIRKTHRTVTAAKRWRADTQAAIRSNALAPASALTFGEAADELLAGMESGAVVTGKGRKRYKPATVRSYRRAIDKRLRPQFGNRKLSDLRPGELQRYVDELVGSGMKPSTVRNTLDPLRVVCRWALKRELISDNPTTNLDVPAADGKRERIASPEEGAALIEALPSSERPLWATAMYAGLRRGELRALRWTDLDLASGVIRVERGWDDEEGPIEGKTDNARRIVPIAGLLRDLLAEHRMSEGDRDPEALVFGRTDADAFVPSTIDNRAKRAWRDAELNGLTLHEARHTFASICIAAGLNAKAIQSYMGHSSIQITFDLYGHLMPGSEAVATEQLDAFLVRSSGSPSGSPTATSADVSDSERIGGEAAIPVVKRELA